jgi:type I restriction enzyme R subunit
VNKNGKEAKLVKTLTENIFNLKVNIVKELQSLDYQTEEYIDHRSGLIQELIKAIQMIDESKFNSRLKLKQIHKFNNKLSWQCLSEVDVRELEDHIASLILSIEDDELAKRFDHLMFIIEYAYLKGLQMTKPKMRVVTTADRLSTKGTIPQVKKQEALILKVQTDEFWDEANIFDYEIVREAFRELIKFLEGEDRQTYYTNFTDEILSIKEYPGDYSVNDLRSYRKKVNAYLKEHQDDIVVYKLRNNKLLGHEDINHLEKLLWEEIGTKDDYIKEFGDRPLLALVSSLVGLDANAANEIFSEFLADKTLNSNQMEFVKMIVEHIVKNGLLDKHVLNEHPFNRYGNVAKLFEDKINVVKDIIEKIDAVNGRVEVG